MAALTLCRPAMAQDKGFGLGVILGEPTGISGKVWVGPNTAFDGAVAWSFGYHSAFHAHLDYLYHNFNLFRVEEGKLALYYGIGGRFKADGDHSDADKNHGHVHRDHSHVGVRVPVGLDYLVEGVPLDIFVEVAPIVELVPDTDISLNGGIGIRYFFGQ